MRALALAVALAVVLYVAGSTGRADTHVDRSDCIEVREHVRGANCNSTDSFRIKIKNTCDSAIDAKYCIEKTSGGWACGMDSGMKSAETTSYYDCHSTGRVWKWARETGSKTKIPEPPAT